MARFGTGKYAYAVYVIALLVLITLVKQLIKPITSVAGTEVVRICASCTRSNDQLSPGELPGYTGWARPASTLAGSFDLVEPYPSLSIEAGADWTVKWICADMDRCKDTNSWFYVRAYGPAIVTSKVVGNTIKRNNVYEFTLNLVDPGLYTVELVVTFSNPPPVTAFPWSGDASFYEGYLASGFPIILTVVPGTVQSKTSILCSIDDLVIRTADSGPQNARWKLIDSNRYEDSAMQIEKFSLQNYQNSVSSLGMRLDYRFKTCNWVSPPSDRCNNAKRKLHLVFIGDSTMRVQLDVLKQRYGIDENSKTTSVTFWELYGGILKCIRQTGPNVVRLLSQLPALDRDEKRIIVWNSGLHDIHRLCGSEFRNDRLEYLTASEQAESCISLYKTALQLVATAISNTPADLVIFQTTTAAWPKYGNYGIAWSPIQGQALPLDAEFIYEFNRVAVDMITTKYKDWKIVDGYWVSLARPDNREVDEYGRIGKKLSHPGLEVTTVLVRMWLDVIMFTFCI